VSEYAFAPAGAGTRRHPWLVAIWPLCESLLAVLIAILAGGVILAATGHDPAVAYRELLQRTLGRPAGLQEVVVRATPLLLAGLAVLLAARAGLWNIGIDGQVLVGALAAGVVGHALDGTNRGVLWLGACGAALVAGALWALVPAMLRVRWGINEIVTTIMFNYVALSLTAWLVKGRFRDESLVTPQTPLIPRELRLATLGDTRVHVGLVVALAVWLALAFWLRQSTSGFELRAVGENPRAARHAMIPVLMVLFVALVVSGALAGLAGANDVLSTKGTFQAEWNPEYGLSAFALVFLARRNVLALVPAALFLGMLSYGADVMPRAAGVPSAFFTLFEGILLIVLAVFRWQPWNRGGQAT
jgi:simple sugar transport system permease protein